MDVCVIGGQNLKCRKKNTSLAHVTDKLDRIHLIEYPLPWASVEHTLAVARYWMHKYIRIHYQQP